MIFELVIENFALIKKLSVNFQQGLNILTGETGAGKSIIIDAMNLVIGERADKNLIRTGEDKAVIQAIFYSDNPNALELLHNNDINYADDGLIILTREIHTSGRSTSRINDKLVTAALVKEISKYLIDIHGQHSHQSLLYSENHIDILDMFQEVEIAKALKSYRKSYNELKLIDNKLKKLSEDSLETERKKDMYSFQINEINEANLSIDEDEKLFEQQKLLANSEKIFSVMVHAYENLNGGSMNNTPIIDVIGNIVKDFNDIKSFDHDIDNINEIIEDIFYKLQDVAVDIRNYKDNIEFEPFELEKIESRLDLISKLKRKYGQSISEILEYRDKIQQELQEIEDSQYLIDKLSKDKETLNSDLLKLSKDLSDKRKKAAEYLDSRMNSELKTLNMEKATFKVANHFNKDKEGNLIFTEKGIDKIEFLISTNAGEPLKPLTKIVSGGEVSRIMLAMRTILAKTDNIPTIIFDEIDAGISGRAANVVGEKLAIISKTHQVLCITHLPQIASMADVHFFIEKSIKNDITTTSINKLIEKSQILELARLLGGISITKLTFEHAKEMLALSQKFKKNIS